MQINVDNNKIAATLVAACLIAAFTWMWRINERVAKIESPDSLLSRLDTIEALIFPMAVEFEVRKRSGMIDDDTSDDGSESEGGAISPTIALPPNTATIDELTRAEDDVRSMIGQRPLEEVRNRRGKPIDVKKK